MDKYFFINTWMDKYFFINFFITIRLYYLVSNLINYPTGLVLRQICIVGTCTLFSSPYNQYFHNLHSLHTIQELLDF